MMHVLNRYALSNFIPISSPMACAAFQTAISLVVFALDSSRLRAHWYGLVIVAYSKTHFRFIAGGPHINMQVRHHTRLGHRVRSDMPYLAADLIPSRAGPLPMRRRQVAFLDPPSLRTLVPRTTPHSRIAVPVPPLLPSALLPPDHAPADYLRRSFDPQIRP
jgi:hypothetical protein